MNKLEIILSQKKYEVANLKKQLLENPNHPMACLLRGESSFNKRLQFGKALTSSSLAVIAEIKRKSPSHGHIAEIPHPLKLANQYCLGGANALSILTDASFFGGNIVDLQTITQTLSIPIIRKDFIIDEIQIAEALYAGASAVLLIVAVLKSETKKMLEYAHTLGLDALVEVHNVEELNIALDSGAEIIGINNRNLHTFDVAIDVSFKLVSQIPNSVIKVAESGIRDPILARSYYQAGFNAVLIGQALVQSINPGEFIRACQYV